SPSSTSTTARAGPISSSHRGMSAAACGTEQTASTAQPSQYPLRAHDLPATTGNPCGPPPPALEIFPSGFLSADAALVSLPRPCMASPKLVRPTAVRSGPVAQQDRASDS